MGILAWGGILFAVIILSADERGDGDLKLGAMIGAFLETTLTLLVLFLAVILGGLVGRALLSSPGFGTAQIRFRLAHSLPQMLPSTRSGGRQ